MVSVTISAAALVVVSVVVSVVVIYFTLPPPDGVCFVVVSVEASVVFGGLLPPGLSGVSDVYVLTIIKTSPSF